jgi:hypothetical protein
MHAAGSPRGALGLLALADLLYSHDVCFICDTWSTVTTAHIQDPSAMQTAHDSTSGCLFPFLPVPTDASRDQDGHAVTVLDVVCCHCGRLSPIATTLAHARLEAELRALCANFGPSLRPVESGMR